MKKKIPAICLSLIGSLSLGVLASCKDSNVPVLEKKDGVIITIGGTEYTNEDLFGSYTGIESAKAYYTALSDIYTQIAVDTTAVIEKTVDDKMDDFYEECQDNATNNGTSKKEEIEKKLESEGVKNETELRQKYMLEAKKDKNNTDFNSDNNILTFRNDYIEGTSPYVTKHILVKVDASSSDLYNGKISEANAIKLVNVIKGLATSDPLSYKNFGEVAQRFSDDSSNTSYGVISAPMEVTTSFVNEYKLGLYAQDYLFNPKVTNEDGISNDRDNLVERTAMPVSENLDMNVMEIIGNATAGSTTYKTFGIPMSEVLNLQKYASTTKADDGTKVKDAQDVNYPRNIIFNHYFNNRSISYIYNDLTEEQCKQNNIDSAKFKSFSQINLVKYADTGSGDSLTTHLTDVTDSNGILTDENGKPIMVTRAGTSGDSGYEGIHFITTLFNPFESVKEQVETVKVENKYDYTKIFEGLGAEATKADKALAVRGDYFNLTIPSQSADLSSYNPSLITSIVSKENKPYTTLAEAVRTALKNTYGSNSDYIKYSRNRLASFEKGAVVNEEIDKMVEDYIKYLESDRVSTNRSSLQDSWKDYLTLVEFQKSLSSWMLPSKCISDFTSGTLGGVCDVSND